MSSDSDVYSEAVQWGKRAGTTAFLAALLLPVLGACGQKATPDRNADAVTMLRFFEHDTQQATLDLGPQGTGPGDQFIYAGDVFDHAGGRQVGHTAGQCTTFSGNATAAGDVLCTATFVLDRGQITMQGLFDNTALFGRGQTLPWAIVGGTGIYRNARGDGTVQVPPDVPNQTDANFVINVVTG
ncbi:MAG TPA: hypothetical protein VFW21_00725 [Mycobacterium sp.]|nr:hypothetical protein [Mycobacterium sp.]